MVYHFCQSEGKTALLVIPSSDPRVLKVRDTWAGCQSYGDCWWKTDFRVLFKMQQWSFLALLCILHRNYQHYKMQLRILKETEVEGKLKANSNAAFEWSQDMTLQLQITPFHDGDSCSQAKTWQMPCRNSETADKPSIKCTKELGQRTKVHSLNSHHGHL